MKGDRKVTNQGHTGLTVLLVEDDPSLRKVLETYLRLNNHQVDLAGNGLAAIRLLERNRYDAVITDIMMPHVDGNQLARYIGEYIDNTPLVVAMSGAAGRAEKPLFAAVLQKPFPLEKVTDIIRAHFEPAAASNANR